MSPGRDSPSNDCTNVIFGIVVVSLAHAVVPILKAGPELAKFDRALP